MMIHRNYDDPYKFTTGKFVPEKKVGRPSQNHENKLIYSQQANFVFKLVAHVSSTDLTFMNETDTQAGWILRVILYNGSSSDIYINCSTASSKSMLSKTFAQGIQGALSMLSAEDFIGLIEQDQRAFRIPIHYISNKCGKISIQNVDYWVYPDAVLDQNGKLMHNVPVFIDKKSFNKSGNMTLPKHIPHPLICKSSKESQRSFVILCENIRKYFGARSMHALHLLTTVPKTLLRGELLKNEHQVSVVNISGPPNIGKTLLCATAASLLNNEHLMVSKCTPSAMLDLAHVFSHQLVIYDDPRDCTHSMMEAIVHDAFHGKMSTTSYKGARSYNSGLIIGTQKAFYGMKRGIDSQPTLSRTTHIDLTQIEQKQAAREVEENLQQSMEKASLAFSTLLQIRYNKESRAEISKLQDTLRQHMPNILERSLRILATDWYFCNELIKIGAPWSLEEVKEYMLTHQYEIMKKVCASSDTMSTFVSDFKKAEKTAPFSTSYVKKNVTTKIDGVKVNCVAFHPKSLYVTLKERIGNLNYTIENIHDIVKNSGGDIGLVAQNVNYRTEYNQSNAIRRSIVIKTVHFDDAESCGIYKKC